ncbi:MAG: ATP-binding region, ATPase domain protein [Frankiales bacterium]|nr:ATP-binding region, ATPase domain protein [Frankiales bacterium]
MKTWQRWAGVRVRAALVASGSLALAIGAGSLLFVVFLQHSQVHDVDLSLTQQAQTLAAVVSQSGSEDIELPARLGTSSTQQVVGRGGRVLAASTDLQGHAPLTTEQLPLGRTRLRTTSLGPDSIYRMLALGAQDARGAPITIVVMQSLEPAEASRHEAIVLLAVGGPSLVLLVAVLTWWVAGRSLRPVEWMRRQVDGIDAVSLDTRVPLPAAEDEVWLLGGTLNRMLDRLESAASAQRQFVSDASHELRSPLAVLRTTVEVAVAHPHSTDWDATAGVLLEETQRVERLVADLLLLANADERGLQLRKGDVDLDDLLSAEADRLRNTTDLKVLVSVQAVRVRGDHDRLARVVRNLVDNAARHATSQVELSVASGPEGAVVEINDDGPGVPVEERDRIFERFVRLDGSRSRQQGGTGLGLAIVRQLVQAHDGTVSFVDASRVRLVLPQ